MVLTVMLEKQPTSLLWKLLCIFVVTVCNVKEVAGGDEPTEESAVPPQLYWAVTSFSTHCLDFYSLQLHCFDSPLMLSWLTVSCFQQQKKKKKKNSLQKVARQIK